MDNYPKGISWYYDEMGNKALRGILTSNTFSESEVELHEEFISDRIRFLGLELKETEIPYMDFKSGKSVMVKAWTYC